ncbi:MAG: hypothetical protein ACRDIB_00765, partial [Ardenticatenaceae bacterium]
MAWWHARLLFDGDDLVGVDLDRLAPEGGRVEQTPNGGLRVTAVQVSGYALYGEVRGYYALAAAKLAVNLESGQTTVA